MIEHLTAIDNVILASALAGMPAKQRNKLAKEALKKVGLEGQEKKYPNELSGGQQQLVTIARAIVKNPDIVLADEPTGSLDSKASKEVLDVLQTVCEDKLLIIASHNEKLVKEYSSRIMHLYDGVLTCEAPAPSVTNTQDGAQKIDASALDERKTSSTIILEGNKVKTQKSRMSLVTGLYTGLNSL